MTFAAHSRGPLLASVLLATTLGLSLACAGTPSKPAAEPAAAATPAQAAPAATPAKGPDAAMFLADPPGFEVVAPGDGTTPAPIYVTVSLNINDFLRPEREDQVVRRFLDTTKQLGIDPVELSFTGEVLDALVRVDPALPGLVKARHATVNEHYRLLQFRKLETTERELFGTDVVTTALVRSKPGSLVAIQKVLGVTPRDNGGVPGELLRRSWSQGPMTALLATQGVQKVNKNDLILHPDRLVAAALSPYATDGHEQVDVLMRPFRQMERTKAGEKVKTNQLDDRLTDLVVWAHLVKLQGLDTAKIAGLADFVDSSRLGKFMLNPLDLAPSDAESQKLHTRAATDPAGTAAALDSVFSRLCELTCAWQDPGAEVRDRLAALDPNKAWQARFSWHASNDYTVESWSKHIIGAEARRSGELTPSATRPEAQQVQIIAAYDAVLRALKENPRVRFVSVDNDTQWMAENSPDKGYPAVFGVSFASVPDALDPEQVDAMGAKYGIEPTSKGAHAGGGSPGRGAGGPGPRSGSPRPGGNRAAPSGQQGETVQPNRSPRGQNGSGARLQPRQNQ